MSNNIRVLFIHKHKKYHQQVSIPLQGNQSPRADGAVDSALGLEIKRHEAQPPLALHVHSLHHAAAVRASSRRRLPAYHPLVLVANKNKAHVFPLSIEISEPFFPQKKERKEKQELGLCVEGMMKLIQRSSGISDENFDGLLGLYKREAVLLE